MDLRRISAIWQHWLIVNEYTEKICNLATLTAYILQLYYEKLYIFFAFCYRKHTNVYLIAALVWISKKFKTWKNVYFFHDMQQRRSKCIINCYFNVNVYHEYYLHFFGNFWFLPSASTNVTIFFYLFLPPQQTFGCINLQLCGIPSKSGKMGQLDQFPSHYNNKN